MKELMEFAEDIAKGLYFMKQTALFGSFQIDGKEMYLDIKLEVKES